MLTTHEDTRNKHRIENNRGFSFHLAGKAKVLVVKIVGYGLGVGIREKD